MFADRKRSGALTVGGLKVEVEQLSAGDGKHFPQTGDKLGMHYTGT